MEVLLMISLGLLMLSNCLEILFLDYYENCSLEIIDDPLEATDPLKI